jgi:hypothetical protein
MLTAIALTPIWNDALEETIQIGSEFRMTDERIISLINIGAAKLPDKAIQLTPIDENIDDVE